MSEGPIFYTYAQEYSGQKLHLVRDYGRGYVGARALCGRTCEGRGEWRMTINVPLANACKNCVRVRDTR